MFNQLDCRQRQFQLESKDCLAHNENEAVRQLHKRQKLKFRKWTDDIIFRDTMAFMQDQEVQHFYSKNDPINLCARMSNTVSAVEKFVSSGLPLLSPRDHNSLETW